MAQDDSKAPTKNIWGGLPKKDEQIRHNNSPEARAVLAVDNEVRTFPEGFQWGVATASYQIEGAVHEGGRSASIWDAFSHTPGKVLGGHNGDVACDHYHRYKEDVQLIKSLGLKQYRLSIAWPRILPAGTGPVNEEGVAFYSNLIDELLANGIEPMVTLYHWDLPLSLQLEFDGWLGGEVVQEAYLQYARVCFERFGDRVKKWLTFNEPVASTLYSYVYGVLAPGRRHNPHTEAYIAAHNILLAHAKAVDIYRRDFKPTQGGQIGITLVGEWREAKPSDDPQEFKRNQEAAERAVLFFLGWFADPVYLGDYPEIIKQRAGDRLPKFTEDEKKLLKGSSDFFGLNHYSTKYAEPTPEFLSGKPAEGKGSLIYDEGVILTDDPSWPRTAMGSTSVPWGFERLILWVQRRYNPAGGIFITESGCSWFDDSKEEAQNDQYRVDYYRAYISHMHKAIQQGADVRGYYAWSLMDNFEWCLGYSQRFGLVWVDYETQERVPKKSARWYSELVSKNTVPPQ